MTPTGSALPPAQQRGLGGRLTHGIAGHWTESPGNRAMVLEIASHWRLDRRACQHLIAGLAQQRVIVLQDGESPALDTREQLGVECGR